MATEYDDTSGFGIGGTAGWLVGGALGGVVGAAAFGLLMWAFDPDVIAAAIPAIYGLDPVGVVGWGIHAVHGLGLGLVFGFLVSRETVLGVLLTDAETEALARTGGMLRLVAAGFVYGLAIWAILPLLVLPVWAGTVGGTGGEFPTAAVESLLGHLLFGTVLGLVFAVTADVSDYSGRRPLED